MKTKCCECSYEFDKEQMRKCPRCGKIVAQKSGCENCNGCSLWLPGKNKSCKDDANVR